MKKTDLAYVAGIIDGEGCIGLYCPPSTNSIQLVVKVALTNEWLIQWLRFAFGGSVRYEPARAQSRKPSWIWVLSANKALAFLYLVSPYLRLKKPQAEVAIKFQEHKFRRRGHILTGNERTVLEAERILMSKLNKRGA